MPDNGVQTCGQSSSQYSRQTHRCHNWPEACMLPECHAKRRGPALRSACSTHAPQRRVLDFRARDEGFKWDLCQQEHARIAEVTVQPSELFRVAQGCCQLNTIYHALRQASCHPLKTSCHWLASRQHRLLSNPPAGCHALLQACSATSSKLRRLLSTYR